LRDSPVGFERPLAIVSAAKLRQFKYRCNFRREPNDGSVIMEEENKKPDVGDIGL